MARKYGLESNTLNPFRPLSSWDGSMNPRHTTLELEMAVGLNVKNQLVRVAGGLIRQGWVMNIKSCVSPVY
ncbi:hypothetical protein N7516_006200 [Penicillium verrucosum]|uniref:uncharacterized protein n=1 Tax=Penicillium verrucosum TaxID=60171 RepID=UPI0025453E73|nr:uncharacterized protein N7516_006200 [Penicillium verrucosum]KAJ5931711.1 hypothetical protein N7516_006200 [Penicillium verrucosum]